MVSRQQALPHLLRKRPTRQQLELLLQNRRKNKKAHCESTFLLRKKKGERSLLLFSEVDPEVVNRLPELLSVLFTSRIALLLSLFDIGHDMAHHFFQQL